MDSSGNWQFGDLIRQRREAAGLSQRAVAKRAGLNVSYINRLESGERRPRRATILKLAATLGVAGAELDAWFAACDLAPMPLLTGLRGPAASGPPAGDQFALETDPLQLWEALAGIGLEAKQVRLLLQNLAQAPQRRQEAAQMVAATLTQVTQFLAAPVSGAVIPAAGGHHRLLAAPVMQRLLLESMMEAASVGVYRFLLVLAPGSEEALYRPLQAALAMAAAPRYHLDYCLQPTPQGLGDAVSRAAAWVGNEMFLVLLPDEMVDRQARRAMPRELSYMQRAWQSLAGQPLIAVETVPRSRLPLGGVVRLGAAAGTPRLFEVEELVEKPPHSHPILEAPTARSIVGRYFLPPAIFAALQEVRRRDHEPLELTTALSYLHHQGTPVYAYELKQSRRDLGGVIARAGGLIGEL